jgi:hypothetical protein
MKKSGIYKTITMAVVISAVTMTFAASAANIGFVAGLTSGALDKPFDLAWSARLTSQGYTVTPIDQTTAANSPTLAGIDLFIVSSDVASGTYLSGVGINQPKPILAYEYGIYDDIFGAAGNAASTLNLVDGLTISNPSHPLAAGLSGNVTIYNGTASMSVFTASSVSSGTQIIAVNAATPTQGIFAVLPADAVGNAGNTWSALRMALPCYDTWADPALVTADGWKLLDNAVAYSLIPEPSSFALIGLGLAALLARRRSR